LDDESVATNKELQKTIVTYTISLREEARSCWKLSSNNSGIYDGLMREARGESVEYLQPSSVFAKNKQMKMVFNIVIEVPCSNMNVLDAKVANDEIDLNFNVQTVYVVQHGHERNIRYDSHRGTTLNFDIVISDRLGKPKPLPQKCQEDSSSQDPDLIE